MGMHSCSFEIGYDADSKAIERNEWHIWKSNARPNGKLTGGNGAKRNCRTVERQTVSKLIAEGWMGLTSGLKRSCGRDNVLVASIRRLAVVLSGPPCPP